IDMEDHTTTDATLRIVRSLRETWPEVGAVVQSYLRRTEDDLADLAVPGSRVRLVKGAYAEPPEVAFEEQHEVDLAFVRCANQLLAGGGYPMFATHDPRLIDVLQDRIEAYGLTPGEYAFQFLYGVRPDEQRRLATAGDTVRIYVPYGDQWYGYLMRRLAERPAHTASCRRAPVSKTSVDTPPRPRPLPRCRHDRHRARAAGAVRSGQPTASTGRRDVHHGLALRMVHQRSPPRGVRDGVDRADRDAGGRRARRCQRRPDRGQHGVPARHQPRAGAAAHGCPQGRQADVGDRGDPRAARPKLCGVEGGDRPPARAATGVGGSAGDARRAAGERAPAGGGDARRRAIGLPARPGMRRADGFQRGGPARPQAGAAGTRCTGSTAATSDAAVGAPAQRGGRRVLRAAGRRHQ